MCWCVRACTHVRVEVRVSVGERQRERERKGGLNLGPIFMISAVRLIVKQTLSFGRFEVDIWTTGLTTLGPDDASA